MEALTGAGASREKRAPAAPLIVYHRMDRLGDPRAKPERLNIDAGARPTRLRDCTAQARGGRTNNGAAVFRRVRAGRYRGDGLTGEAPSNQPSPWERME